MFKGKNIVLVSLLVLMFLGAEGVLPTFNTLSIALASNITNQQVKINIVGNGTLTVIEKAYNVTSQNFYTITQFIINHSTTFTIPNGTAIILESNESFIPIITNNQGMITKIYGIEILSNTTINVNFNVQNFTFPPSEYSNITFVLYNSGYLNITVTNVNNTIVYTFMTINKTTSLEVPIDTLIIYHSNVPFTYNNSSKIYRGGGYFIIKYPNYIIPIIFFVHSSTTNTSTSTTTNSSTSTFTSTISSISSTTSSSTTSISIITTTIPPHTRSIVPISSSTPAKSIPIIIILVIVIVTILAIVVYLVLKRR